MRPRGTLLRRTMAFLLLLVASLAVTSFFVVNHASRAALQDLFRQRLAQAEDVLAQYTQAEHLVRSRELEIVLGSPRFLAAIETADPTTIAIEVPSHPVFSAAELIVVANHEGDVLWGTSNWSELEAEVYELLKHAPIGDFQRTFLESGGRPLEVIVTTLVANNGIEIGRMITGTSISSVWADELHRLTGFGVLVALEDRVLSAAGTDLGFLDPRISAMPAGDMAPIELDGEEFLVKRLDDPESRVSVVFLASVGRVVSPLLAGISQRFALVSLAAAALALLVAYVFLRKRVWRQVQELVRAAERIAEGNLEAPVRSGSDDELGYLAAEFDRMRQNLARNRTELEAAHRAQVDSERMAAVGKMAAGIVHDFKNPMGVVLGTADLIEAKHGTDEKLARQCRVIRGQVERMDELTRDLLEYSRGEVSVERTEVNVADWIRGFVSDQYEPFRRANVELTTDGPTDLRARLDPNRMRRVFDNLLNNAREASRAGMTVRLRWREWQGDGLEFEVLDQGAGIPEEVRDRLFEPFVTAGKQGGSGLGLAITKKIVGDHEAEIEVTDAPGGGARFVVRMPACRCVDREALVEDSVS